MNPSWPVGNLGMKPTPIDQPCPKCGAKRDETCKNDKGRVIRGFHSQRWTKEEFIQAAGIARLDELQSVVVNQLEATKFALAREVCDVLRSQVSYFFTGLSGQDFAGWADLLKG
jgi:hypothetical protein